uniref:Epidermal growth factor n=1 Tax=Cyprinus carpio carpio TaxID=630221 RepID=A0A8C1BTN5_CYPCA
MFWRTIAGTFHLGFWMVSIGPARAPGCVGKYPEPYLLLGLGNSIQRMNLNGGHQRRIISRVGRSILLDFHLSEGTMVWADTHAGQINRAGLDGTRRQKLLSSVKGIMGLAVDWIENTVLWSIVEKGTIQKMDTDGKNKKIVLRDLSQPRSVVVDHNERYIFWLSDGLTPSIQRSDMTGGKKAAVLKGADRLKALALDHRDRRLFWVQQSLRGHTAMGSCNYDVSVNKWENKLTCVTYFKKHLFSCKFKSNRVDLLHICELRLEGDTVCSYAGCNRHTGECGEVCSSHSDTGLCRCRDGFSLSKQGNYCEDINECALWNHGCSLGCENVPGSYFCTCPKGYLLLPDLKTCQETKPCVENGTVCDHACVHTAEGDACVCVCVCVCVCPEGSVLNPDGRSCTGCLSAAQGGCSQMCVTLYPGRWVCECQPGYQLHPDGRQCAAPGKAYKLFYILHSARVPVSGPPMYLLFANIVDIRQINADGKKSKTLLEEPRGSIIAVDYDPVQKQVYFADKGLKRIERASLDGGFREMLFSTGLDSPVIYNMLIYSRPISCRLGLAHCSCHSKHVLSADGKDCLAINTSFTETDDRESSDRLRNKTLNDVSTPLAMLYTERMVSDQNDCYSKEGQAMCQCVRGLDGEGELCVDVDECKAGLADYSISEAECVNTAGGYFCQCKTGFNIDECLLDMHAWDVNAEFLNAVGKYQCRYRPGFTGTGFSCHEEVKSASCWPSTGSPLNVTSPWQHNKAAQSCTFTHDSYCLYDGVCFYFPEMESNACMQVFAYIACCTSFNLIFMILIIPVFAYSTIYILEHVVGSISMSGDSITESTTATPHVCVVLDTSPCSDEKVLYVAGCPRTTVFPIPPPPPSFALEEAGELQTLDVANCSVSCDMHTLLVTVTTDHLISLEDLSGNTPVTFFSASPQSNVSQIF